MEFEGREQLALSSTDFFENNKDKFLSFAKNVAKEKKEFDLEYVSYVFEDIYDSFLIKTPDYENIRKNLKKTFKEQDEFIKYIVSRSFLRILSLYILSENDKLHVYFTNALSRALKHILKENLLAIKPSKNTQECITFANSALDNSGFNAQKEIVDEFRNSYDNGDKLTFLNLYKDVPIKNHGKILSIDSEEVTFSVDLMQILAMTEEKNAFFLKNGHLSSHIKADIINFNIVNSTVKLGNFQRMESMPANQRVHTRVHPNITTSVVLYNKENQSTRGILYDISNDGLGVLAADSLGCQNGDKLKAIFELNMPQINKQIQITQELELVVLISYEETYRFCMKNIGDISNDIKIFTKCREEETIRDLKECAKKYIK